MCQHGRSGKDLSGVHIDLSSSKKGRTVVQSEGGKIVGVDSTVITAC